MTKRVLIMLIVLVFVSSFCFGITNEEFEDITKLIIQSADYSDIVVLNQNIEGKVTTYNNPKLSLVIIGPSCHRLPGFFFYGGSIENLIILTDDLNSTGSLNIFNTEIKNTFSNVPYFFVEDVVKRVLKID